MKAFGYYLRRARLRRGLNQRQLASALGMSQRAVSFLESGKRQPDLDELLQLAGVLRVSLQWFLSGTNRPSVDRGSLGFELHELGLSDLLTAGESVPGAFRPPEEVVALALSGNEVEPRLIEAMPALLAWNHWSVPLLRAYPATHDARAEYRTAWLADVALTIHQHFGFPGGCPAFRELSALLLEVQPPKEPDGLGWKKGRERPLPVSRRWNITYPGNLDVFRKRAEHLLSSREQPRDIAASYIEDGHE